MPVSLSGSLLITGSLTVTEGIIMSGSIASASFATNASLLNGTGSGDFTSVNSFNSYTSSTDTKIASINTTTGSQNTRLSALETASGSAITRLTSLENRTGSYATTGSNNFNGTQTITGSLLQSGNYTTTGTITAQTINVQQVTSSIVYSCGSNVFGTAISNIQQLTGSVGITGSLALVGSMVGSSTMCSVMVNASCIGIGTTSPSTTLDVNGTGRFGSAATKLTTYSDSAYSGIFNGASLGSNESIYMGDGRMFFFASGSERIRLTSTGLGIGTTSPAARLHVSNGGQYGIEIDVANEIIQAYNRTSAEYQEIKLYSSNLRFFNGTSSTITERMRITSGGSVGIGTTSPYGQLDSYTACSTLCNELLIRTEGGFNGSVYPALTFGTGGQGSNIRQAQIRAIGDNNYSSALTFWTQVPGTANPMCERMRITSGGNVGIGTCNPVVLTQLEGNNANAEVQLRLVNNNLTNGNKYLALIVGGTCSFGISGWANSGILESAAGTNSNLVIGNYEDGPIIFQTNNRNEKVRITGGGFLGIGTTSPCYKLDVRNASGTGAQTIVSVVNRTNDSNTGAFIGFGDAYTDTVSPYLFAARVGGTREGAGDGGFMSFYTRPTSGFEYERMRITAGGIACFACQTCTPQSVITSGFYSTSNMIIITNDVQDGRKTILNNTPVSIFQICKPAGLASSASYSLLGGHLYINLGLRFSGGYTALRTITYPFFINSAGTGNISLVLGTPTCLTGFDNTGGETTSFGISLCGASNTTATVIVCASTTNFTIEGSTIMTVSMVANRTALLDEPISIFKI